MYTYIVRHGETDLSQNGIIQGHFQNSLNSAGVDTIKKIASYIADNNIFINSIYSSELSRCAETAKIIARKIGFNKEINYDPALREISLGIYEGRHKDELERARVDSGHYFAFIPQGGESIDMLFLRIKNWIDLYCDKLENALIISHRGPISAIYYMAENRDEWDENLLLEHGKIIVFDFSSAKKKIVNVID